MQNAESERDLRSRTKQFARRIIHLYLALPKKAVAQVLGKQLSRAGTSVGANYREANRGRSKAEFISKIGDGLKEVDESLYWLERLSEENVLKPSRLSTLISKADELTAIFVAISKRSKGQ